MHDIENGRIVLHREILFVLATEYTHTSAVVDVIFII